MSMKDVQNMLGIVSAYMQTVMKYVTAGRVVVVVVCIVAVGTVLKINAARTGEHAQAITTIARSLRFNSADTAYLTFTNGVTSSRDMWTMSLWTKRGTLSSIQTLFSSDTVTADDRIYFDASDRLAIDIAGTVRLVSTQVFRDPAAWYHILVQFDAANATAANKLKVFVNGEEITSWTTNTRSAIAAGTAKTSHSSIVQTFGRTTFGATNYLNAYLADIYFVSGSLLGPTSFGELDSTTKAWQPIAYAGACGTNGYHLTFADNSNTTSATLGNDTCNNNDFTPTNFSVAAGAGNDSLTDTPTNNYATGNPLQSGSGTFSNGNLDNTATSYSTFFMDSGKWYWEVTANAAGVTAGAVTAAGAATTTAIANGITRGFRFDSDSGLLESTTDGTSWGTVGSGLTGGRFTYVTGGSNTYNFGQRAFAYTQPSGFSKLSSDNLAAPTISNPANYFSATSFTGSGAAQDISQEPYNVSYTTAGTYTFTVPAFSSMTVKVYGAGGGGGGSGDSAGTCSVAGTTGNTGGNSTFNATLIGNGGSGGTGGNTAAGTAGASGTASGGDTNSDGNGSAGGAAGTGCDFNGGAGGAGGLAIKTYGPGDLSPGSTVTVVVGASATGGSSGGGTSTAGKVLITYTRGGSFTPDLVWIKDRTSANTHGIYDAVRAAAAGASYGFLTNSSAASNFIGQGITAFGANGFTVGTNSNFNTNTNNYVSWNWKEDPVGGFDIVTYTGSGSNRTIAHSLSSAPEMMIIKNVDTTDSWAVYHRRITTPTTQYLDLGSTAAQATDATVWNSTAPTSSVFSVGTSSRTNTSGEQYVAYLFDEKDGFSKIGGYTGTGNATEGPFVFTGFKPKFIMIKRANSTGDWYIWDTARDTVNPASKEFIVTTASTEGSTADLDFLSNGFKISATTAGYNTSGGAYVYAAFAEEPFQHYNKANGYTVANAVRFNGSTARLNRTPAAASDRTTWTWSGWIKQSGISSRQVLFAAGPTTNGGNDYTEIAFNASGQIQLTGHGVTTTYGRRTSSNFYRDPTRWMHVVVVYDTTAATGSDRAKVYVDGVQLTQFSSSTDPTLSTQAYINSTQQHSIGYLYNFTASPGFLDGYLADIHFIDGIATTADAFGAFDSNGVWQPKSYTGTYGTNGFHLDFSNSADPGNDSSGLNNDWTATNIATTDNVIDTPTNNFNVLNTLITDEPTGIKNGGLRFNGGNAFPSGTGSTLAVTSGKWYVETYYSSVGVGYDLVGWYSADYCTDGGNQADVFACIYANTHVPNDKGVGFYTSNTIEPHVRLDGTLIDSNPTWFGPNMSDGNMVISLIDVDLKRVWFGIASTPGGAVTWIPTAGNPYSGGPGIDVSSVLTTPVAFGFAHGVTGTTPDWYPNFGQVKESPYGANTYDAASGGYFKYAPPSGYKALTSANIAAATITTPENYFDTKTYTGTGASQSLSSLAFTPALVWLKDRTTANAHGIFDSVRALGALIPYLASNTTAAQIAISDGLTAFASGGFSLGANALFNTANNNYISWMWKEDATAGFDIVSYTGTGANATVSHSLGGTPEFMMIKNYGAVGAWTVWHKDLTTPTTQYMVLNTTALPVTDATMWNSTIPTATNFSVGTNAAVNTAANTYIAYLFKSVAGFSKIGSYTGNASADGAFVYTGFKPKFVMVKRMTGATGSWVMWDSSRNQYNVVDGQIIAEANTAQTTVTAVDFVANGFKLRATTANFNAAATYVYAAFAELPFKYSSGIGGTIFSVPASVIFMEF